MQGTSNIFSRVLPIELKVINNTSISNYLYLCTVNSVKRFIHVKIRSRYGLGQVESARTSTEQVASSSSSPDSVGYISHPHNYRAYDFSGPFGVLCVHKLWLHWKIVFERCIEKQSEFLMLADEHLCCPVTSLCRPEDGATFAVWMSVIGRNLSFWYGDRDSRFCSRTMQNNSERRVYGTDGRAAI